MNRSTTHRRLGRLATISMVSLLGITGLDAITSMASASEGGRARSEHHAESRGRWHRDRYRHHDGADRDEDRGDCGRGNTAPPPAPYVAPVIQVSAATDTTPLVSVTWTAPSNTPSAVVGYRVHWRISGTSAELPAVDVLAGTSADFESTNAAPKGTDLPGSYDVWVAPLTGAPLTELGASNVVTIHLA
jgi:hypothetical protein